MEVKMENYNKENDLSRERLKQLVNRISDEELKLVIYKEGWTVATALGHLAFWDERRTKLYKKWLKSGIVPEPVMDFDVLNDALLTMFLKMPPRATAEMAVTCAETVDKTIRGLPGEMVLAISRMGDVHALNRSVHRTMHLDEIDELLKAKKKK
jgi:hypothetical protein